MRKPVREDGFVINNSNNSSFNNKDLTLFGTYSIASQLHINSYHMFSFKKPFGLQNSTMSFISK